MLSLCPDWCWQYCEQQDRLLLQMSASHHIQTAFSAKELLQQPDQAQLSLDQAQLLMEFAESLEGQLPDDELLAVSVQAVAALSFVKAPVQKSHLFNVSSIEAKTQVMALARLEGETRAKVLIVSKTDPMVDCLLLEPMTLLNGKQLCAGQLVRVQQNRLLPFRFAALYALSA